MKADHTIIECPTCRQMINVGLEICPHCGQRTRKARLRDKYTKLLESDNRWGKVFLLTTVVSFIWYRFKYYQIANRGFFDSASNYLSGDYEKEMRLMQVLPYVTHISLFLMILCVIRVINGRHTLKLLDSRPELYWRSMKKCNY